MDQKSRSASNWPTLALRPNARFYAKMADESASDSTQSTAPQTVPQAPSTAPLNQEEDEGWKQDGFGRWYIPKGEWWAVFDAKTQRIYYQNQTSQQTQWTVPEAWKKPTWEAEVEKMMKRPARRQAKAQDKSKVHWRPEGAFEYNIWYHKWVGEHWKGDRERGIQIPPRITIILID